MIRLRKKDEFFGTIAAPARGNGDAIFFVDGMAKFAGVEGLRRRWRFHTREENLSILTHFPPLLTTLHAALSIKY